MPINKNDNTKYKKLFHYIKTNNYDKFTSLLSSFPNINILSIKKKYKIII